MYEVAKFIDEVAGIRRLSDGAFIPIDDNNADYRKYLEWKAKNAKPSANPAAE